LVSLSNEKMRERGVFDEIAARLQRVDPDVTFEFGPNAPKREFVISAGGLKRAFLSVASFVGSAPPLERWWIIAFRPRRRPVNVVEFHGRRIDPKDVQFTLLSNGSLAGIRLVIPSYDEADSRLKQIGYLLLDEALGEYDVETRVGLIEMLPPEAAAEGRRYPLAELPKQFDE